MTTQNEILLLVGSEVKLDYLMDNYCKKSCELILDILGEIPDFIRQNNNEKQKEKGKSTRK